MAGETAQDTLHRILEDLKSDDIERQLSAIREIESLTYSSEAIVLQLERLALKGEDAVRKPALNALNLKTSQFVVSKRTALAKHTRHLILVEIEAWRENGLIEPHHAEVLKRLYDFDMIEGRSVKAVPAPPIESKPETVAPSQAAQQPIPVPAPRPAGPRPSLAQVLLSETSIRIYLFLGAFFVIASAAILAALVEAARIPILLVATVLFAAGALGFKKRLPQPSFAFAIVFSFLLPIDANVVADTIGLSARSSPIYWSVVFLAMTAIWVFGTRFYESRLFSLAAFLALTLSLLNFSEIFDAPTNWNIVTVAVANLAGLSGVHFLKKWRDERFSVPLFVCAQLLEIAALLALISSIGIELFNADYGTGDWLSAALALLLAASFYAGSGILIPFVLFPWMAVTSLLLFPWLFLSAFDASSPVMIAGFTVWGTLSALLSEFVHRSIHEAARKYNLPLLIISLPLFFIAVVWGSIEGVEYLFAALLATGIVYTLVHALRARWYVWMTALVAGVGAYFTFFALPIFENVDVYFGYPILGAGLLLLIPELFFKEKLTFGRQWNWPPVALGVLITGYNIFSVHAYLLTEEGSFLHTSVILAVDAVLFAAYALRFKQPLIGYLAAASTSLTVVYALEHFDLDLWMPLLTLLTALFYFAGFLLSRREERRAWGAMLVNSGLALGTIVSLIAVFSLKPTGGWYALVIAALFAIEMFTRRNGYLEFPAIALLGIALIVVLHDFGVYKIAYHFFGLSLAALASDAVLKLTYKERPLRIITWLAGGSLTIAAVGAIVETGIGSGSAAICFAAYTLFFAAYAWIHRQPMLGYLSTASAAAMVFNALDHFGIEAWLPVFTGLSLLYFTAGYLLRKRSAGWSDMFRYSGLTLGSLVSVIALVSVERFGGWYAAVVGLLFIVETVTSRNGWLEAGVHVLFSIAGFLILNDFKVYDLSYILLAIGIIWLGGDVIFERAVGNRKLSLPVRLVGAGLSALNAFLLLFSPSIEAAICFGVYTLFFALFAWLYKQPLIGYASTVSLPLAAFFTLRAWDREGWIFPLIAIAVIYYAAGFLPRRAARAKGWDSMLILSGLGLGTLVALTAPYQAGGIGKAIPIAIAATLFASEAYARRNVWLAFPANALYLISYFTLLLELDVDEPQYFSIGAALLGMVMHYLLVRAKGRTGAFVMGMISQFVLLGTTYLQMVSTSQLGFFFVLFVQSLVILVYGIVMRSRSLVIAPIVFAVLGTVTVLYSALKDLSIVVLICVTGIVLLILGVIAVLTRERITTLAEKFSDWNA